MIVNILITLGIVFLYHVFVESDNDKNLRKEMTNLDTEIIGHKTSTMGSFLSTQRSIQDLAERIWTLEEAAKPKPKLVNKVQYTLESGAHVYHGLTDALSKIGPADKVKITVEKVK